MAYRGPYNPRIPVPDGEASISIYGYVPSKALAIVALVTFGIALLVHGYYLSKAKRTRTFQFLLCFGCCMEIVGYSFRSASSANPFVIIRFVIQYFMIVCAPVFFTAALYLSLSIAVRRLASPAILPLSPKKLVAIFVVIDVVTTALQVLGAAFIGVSESTDPGETSFITTNAANNILLAGLAVQCLSFLVFLSLVALTWIRNNRNADLSVSTSERKVEADAEVAIAGTASLSTLPTRFLVVLTVSSLAIWLRTLFRLGETAEGVFGFASTHESMFGVLEYTPVIVAIGLWAAFPLFKLLHT